MELAQWQHRFERWLDENHFTDDAAHDIAHFRRVWMTAQAIMADGDCDPLVVLTACYFHDIVSLPKNHPQRSHSSRLAARETRQILSRDAPGRLRQARQRADHPAPQDHADHDR